MKIFLALFVFLSIVYGLDGRHHKPCKQKTFPEPEPRDIHYIYHGESCDCPKYHDTIVQKPVEEQVKYRQRNYEYDIHVPRQAPEEDEQRYVFDVRVEQPVKVETRPERLGSYNYKLQKPKEEAEQESVRYMFDTRVEEPVKPCEEKPYQGLVAQVDKVLLPRNCPHKAGTCNCGCRDKSHTPKTCNCGSNNYKLPIYYNSRYEKTDDSENNPIFTFPDSMSLPNSYQVGSRKVKRDVTQTKKPKTKRPEIKWPKLKSLKKTTKEPKPLKAADMIAQPAKKCNKYKQLRSKRKPASPCGYTYESCDPKRNNRNGCPLCYKCKCEPSNSPVEGQKFSPNDLNVPYKVVTQDEAPRIAPKYQEFDDEPPTYTGLKEQNMYKKYIQQIVSKYPEHMARKMPDIQEQQRDLLKFIDQLANSSKSPGLVIDNEDVRYKMLDNAVDLYKYYERAMGMLPKATLGFNAGKATKKRGTILEVIELNGDEFDESYDKNDQEDFEQNVSESQ